MKPKTQKKFRKKSRMTCKRKLPSTTNFKVKKKCFNMMPSVKHKKSICKKSLTMADTLIAKCDYFLHKISVTILFT